MANDRDLNVRLNADPTGFERGFKAAEKSAARLERELAKVEAAQRQMAGYEAEAYRAQEQRQRDGAQALSQVGTVVGIASAALVAGLGKAVMTAADFDAQMSKVQAATGLSTSAMGELRDAAIKMGADSVFSATEAAQGIEELAKAGVSTADILGGGLEGALNLAAAGSISVADAAEAAASAMTQFGLSGEQVPHIADLLAAAAGKAQGGVSDMNQALGQGGLIAAQMGLTIEQTTGTLAAFASAGLMGSDAGTSFKTMLIALANPSEQASKTMEELGINAYDAQGRFVGVASLAEQLKVKLGALTAEQRNSALATIFGTDAMRAASVLYQEGGAGIDEWVSSVNDSGYAADVAGTNMDNLRGDIEKLKGALQTAGIELGGGKLGEGARFLAQEIERVVEQFNSLPTAVKSDVQFLGAAGAALGLAGSAALLLVPKIDEVRETWTRASAAGGKFVNALKIAGPIGLFVAAAAGAVVVGTQLADAITKVESSAEQTTAALMDLGGGARAAGSDFAAFDTRIFGQTVVNVDDASEAVDRFGRVAKGAAGGGLREFYDTVASIGSNKRDFTNMVETLDQQLANMVQNGHAKEAAQAYKELVAAATAQGVPLDEVTGKFTLYADAVDSTQAAARSAAAATRIYTDANSEASGVAQELSEEQAKLREEMVKSLAAFIDPISAYTDALSAKEEKEKESARATADSTEDSKDSWEDYYKDVKLSVQEYIDSLQSQIDAQNNWEANILKVASRGAPQAVVDQLISMGVEGASTVQAFVDATDEEFGRLVDLLPASTKEATTGAVDVLRNSGDLLKQVAEVSGQATADAYSDALANGTMTVQEVAIAYRDMLRANIPDEATTEIMVDGVAVSRQRILEVARALDTYLKDKSVIIRASIRTASTELAGSGQRVGQGAGGAGGLVFAAGGPVAGPGTGTSDSIPAWLSDGEYVIRASQTAKHRDLLDAINSGRQGYATGGLVGSSVALSLPNPEAVRAGMNATVAGPLAAIQTAANAAARAAEAAASATEGGTFTSPGGGGASVAALIAYGRALRAQGLTVSENRALGDNPAPGDHSAGGWHYRANNSGAIDVNSASGESTAEKRRLTPVALDAARRGFGVIWLAPNHYNHLHVDASGRKQIGNTSPYFDRGGVARGIGALQKNTIAPERVLSPEQTASFERLVQLLEGRKYAAGGIVRAARSTGTAVAGSTTDGATGSTWSNQFDINGYLNTQLAPKSPAIIDDSALRAANFALANWNSMLSIAKSRLEEATKAEDYWADELRAASSDLESAQRDVESSTNDVARAQKGLADSEKSLARLRKSGTADADQLADAEENLREDRAELAKATTDLTAAQKDVVAQTERVTNSKQAASKATEELAAATLYEASMSTTATQAAEAQTRAQEELTAAKADALAYAQKISQAALSGTGIISLFSNDDPVRAARFATAAYDASVAQAQAATDAGEWQAKLDAVAAAGVKVAATQRNLGASYAQTKAILVSTRLEVEKLALSYGFTATESAALADSAVDLGASAESIAKQLEVQLKNLTEFAAVVKALRNKGLDDSLVQQLIEAGPNTGLAVGQSILDAGQSMIDRLNTAQSGLTSAAASLAKQETAAKYGGSEGITYQIQPLPQVGSYTDAPTPTITRVVRTTRAAGGIVLGEGGPTDDLIPAMLSNGEFVMKAAAVSKYGERYFDDLNAMRYAGGGLVSRSTPYAGRSASPVVVQVTAPESTDRGPAIGSVFGSTVIRETVDVEAGIQRAKFLAGGALGSAVVR